MCREYQEALSEFGFKSHSCPKVRVAFIGFFSAGKTSIIASLLDQDFEGMNIKPDPSTNDFECLAYRNTSSTTRPHSDEELCPPGLFNEQRRRKDTLHGKCLLRVLRNSHTEEEWGERAKKFLSVFSLVDSPGITQEMFNEKDVEDAVKEINKEREKKLFELAQIADVIVFVLRREADVYKFSKPKVLLKKLAIVASRRRVIYVSNVNDDYATAAGRIGGLAREIFANDLPPATTLPRLGAGEKFDENTRLPPVDFRRKVFEGLCPLLKTQADDIFRTHLNELNDQLRSTTTGVSYLFEAAKGLLGLGSGDGALKRKILLGRFTGGNAHNALVRRYLSNVCNVAIPDPQPPKPHVDL